MCYQNRVCFFFLDGREIQYIAFVFLIMTVEVFGCLALPKKTPSHIGGFLRHLGQFASLPIIFRCASCQSGSQLRANHGPDETSGQQQVDWPIIGRSGADKGPTRGQGVHFLSNQTVSILTMTHIAWTAVVIHRPIMRQSLQADLDRVEVANHYGTVWYAAAGQRRALHSNTASAAWLGAVLYSIKANFLRILQRSSKQRKKDPHPSAPSHAFFFFQISLSPLIPWI